MADQIPAPSPDFTDLDFDSLTARADKLISQVFPAWNKSRAGIHNTLKELLCHVGEVVVARIDNEALESKFQTLRLRRSLIAKGKMINFALPGAAAAQCHVQFSLPGGARSVDVLVPAGTLLGVEGQGMLIVFQTTEATTIPAGSTVSGSVLAQHSRTYTASFTSTGQPFQAYTLPRAPYLDDSAAVEAEDGVYAVVDSLLLSTSTDRHVTVEVDEDGYATFRFGNGIKGAVPQGTVSLVYKTGGGQSGNGWTAGEVSVLLTRLVDAVGQPVTVAAANTDKADGGADRMSVQEGKALVPQLATALTRCVSREDYEVNAKRLTAIGRVLMLVSDVDPSVDENSGKLYVMPTGTTAQEASAELCQTVYDYLDENYPWPATFDLQVLPAQFKTVDVWARVFRRSGYTQAQVRANIEAALAALFQPCNEDGTENTEINFGFYYQDENGDADAVLTWGDIYTAVKRAAGVRKVEEDDFVPLDDVILELREFPKLGTITLLDGDTGVVF